MGYHERVGESQHLSVSNAFAGHEEGVALHFPGLVLKGSHVDGFSGAVCMKCEALSLSLHAGYGFCPAAIQKGSVAGGSVCPWLFRGCGGCACT